MLKRFWQSKTNPRVVLGFDQPVDILSMEKHPDYIEVKKDGTPVAKAPKNTEQREPWQFPLQPATPAKRPSAKKASK